MRRLSVSVGCAVVVTLLACSPRTASASEILFLIEEGAQGLDPGFTFGQVPFQMHAGFNSTFIDGGLVVSPEVAGTATLLSGPLVDLTVQYDSQGDPTTSLYTYGPGTLAITALWNLPNGTTATGSFLAPLLHLQVQLTESCFFGACGNVFAQLGAGLFDPSLAALLGVRTVTSGGSFFLPADLVSGGPFSTTRVGGSASGQAFIFVTADVPEPLPLALLSAGLLVLWRRVTVRR